MVSEMRESTTNPTLSDTSGCPVKKERRTGVCPINKKDSNGVGNIEENKSIYAWLGMSRMIRNETCPQQQQQNQNSLPASVEESLQHNQLPMPDQKVPLSTHRVISSIPKSDKGPSPAHQSTLSNNEAATTAANAATAENHNWVYPSEQQFYNAMRRKGWDAPDEANMASVIQIHNVVNEQSWRQVRQWEKELHGCDHPKLVRFIGRPDQMSPKAWIYSNLLMYKPPFDRHDWFVESEDHTVTRYVIDFYEGQSKSGGGNGNQNVSPVSLHLDVRPALDHPRYVLDRIKVGIKEMLPGIFPPN